jgi:hypothetical protein
MTFWSLQPGAWSRNRRCVFFEVDDPRTILAAHQLEAAADFVDQILRDLHVTAGTLLIANRRYRICSLSLSKPRVLRAQRLRKLTGGCFAFAGLRRDLAFDFFLLRFAIADLLLQIRLDAFGRGFFIFPDFRRLIRLFHNLENLIFQRALALLRLIDFA